MKAIRIFLSLAILTSGWLSNAEAQTKKTFKVGLFVSLHLDSAFDASNNYRYGKGFPRQSVPGLEFFEGAEFALDTLRKHSANIDFYVYDYKSTSGAIPVIARTPVLDSLDLIIGQVSGTEYLQLAQIAQDKKIPFVSATYPNDGGVKNNPQVIMVNGKLNTHIQSLYGYILRNWGTQNIVWYRRNLEADNRIETVFKELNQSPGGGVMKYKTVNLPDQFGAKELAAKLDSTRDNVLIAGSLDENFARKILSAAAALPKSYRITLVGMPTWESLRELSRSEYRQIPLVYSTTFYSLANGQNWSGLFEEAYRKKTFSKPSDMAFRGFEVTHYFTQLLMKWDTAMLGHLNDPMLRVISDYNFMPVRWDKGDTEPDYHENKRIYILRRLQGQVTQLQ